MKRVLIACEYSQIVTTAFRQIGALAYSCDVLECEGGHPEWHIKKDVLEVLEWGWDLVIAHPPCTYLCRSSGIRKSQGLQTEEQMNDAREFFMKFVALEMPRCIENPVPLRRARLPPYSQIVNPFQFGHPFSKLTCLWLYNLPQLLPMRGYYTQYRSWVCSAARDGHKRSRFWEGIAEAMAAQWLPLV